MKQSILDTSKLQKFAKSNKLQPFRVKQIQQEIFKNQNINFDDMTTLSKDLREQLKQTFNIITLQPEAILETSDTVKI